jgi:phage tail sheath protein FI
MPVSPTYPGVYIQEIDSGSKVVTGVATSITAFIGRAARGPANEATTVFDFGDFETLFGGLARDLPMTYAVQDFFNNGGSQAVIVRIVAGPPLASPAQLKLGAYTFTSVLGGAIANLLSLGVAANPDTKGNYDFTVSLGTGVTLATLTNVAPENIDMQLKTLLNLFLVDGSVTDPDDADKIFKPLIGKASAFTNGADQPDPDAKAATFVALDLVITAAVKGSWTNTLALTLEQAGGGFELVMDHPLLSEPAVFPFKTWDDLKAKLAPTKLLTLTTPSTTAPGDLITADIPLTRVPDGYGNSAAMLTAGPLIFAASSPGEWGNQIGIYFDKKNVDKAAFRFVDYGIYNADNLWNINVVYPIKPGQTPPYPVAETIGPVYVGTIDAPCRIDHMLEDQSQYLTARAPIQTATSRQLLQDPTQINADDPKNPGTKIGVLTGGADGESLSSIDVVGSLADRTGMYALETADLFNIMVIPPDPLLSGDDDMKPIYQAAATYCSSRRAILIADPLDSWSTAATKSQFEKIAPTDFNIDLIYDRRVVFTYFPRVIMQDALKGNREGLFSASGIIAGIFAATDVARGVWKAPAGIEAGMNGVVRLEHKLTDMQNGVLNQVGVNVLRDFPVFGKVIWGSRTLAGADALSDDYKYLPVRRLTDYIEESLLRGTKFAVFEPNAEPLWSQLRLSIGAFMADLARQGAFYDYYVLCDAKTTTALDIAQGRVNVTVAFAPVKPAEFVILSIQQLAGQTAS